MEPGVNLLCNVYKNKKRTFMQYRGFVLPSVKLLIAYHFPTHILKIQRNSAELQFDIYLSKFDKENRCIDFDEVEGFRKFFGPGLNLIILSPEQVSSSEDENK